MSDIVLPYGWKARPHQSPFMSYMFNGGKRAVCVWHRRAGKDSGAENFTVVEAHKSIGNYWHMLPTAQQGRNVVWNNIDPTTGIRVIDQVFPKEIRESTNETEMLIKLKCGSTWQVVGSDNYDRLVGANPRGVVFSEWSLADPRAWDFIRPILAENKGWAIFIYTSRGKNHGYDMYEMAKNNPDWFCELLTIEDTKRNDGSPVITQEEYQAEINSGMDPQLALQEFYCSFDAGLFGAYYTEQVKRAKIGDYPWNPMLPVHTFWDLGLRDATAIWFGQAHPNGVSINVIDYEEGNNISLAEWIKIIKEKPYTYGNHVAPHDIKRRDYKDGKSYIKFAREFGIDFEVCPDIGIKPGIDAVKAFLPRVNFNMPLTKGGYDALTNYRREYNSKLKIFMDRPSHDWASHGADAMRMMAIAWPDDYSSISRNFSVKTTSGKMNRVRRRK